MLVVIKMIHLGTEQAQLFLNCLYQLLIDEVTDHVQVHKRKKGFANY